MKTTIEIIDELRADTAELAGKILLFQKRPDLTAYQKKSVDAAFKSLRFMSCHHFCLLRHCYGDEKWQKLGDIDIPDILRKKDDRPDPPPVPIAMDIEEIVTDARKLHQKMLELPGENGSCDSADDYRLRDEKSKAIEYLLMGFDFWRGVEMSLMKKEFE